MIELSPLDAALDNVLELARVIPGSGFVRHIKMGLNDIVHIPQQQRRPLLDVVAVQRYSSPVPRSMTVRTDRAERVDFTSLRRRLVNRIGAHTWMQSITHRSPGCQ